MGLARIEESAAVDAYLVCDSRGFANDRGRVRDVICRVVRIVDNENCEVEGR